MISRVKESNIQIAKQPLTLRENQIIQGKITKIYPNNKAEIQIGGHKLVAEILTPLSVGKNYFFQVQEADHIQLKVLGEQLQQPRGNGLSMEALLNQLGLKLTKLNNSLVEQLVNDKIPFNKEQLEQAFSILKEAPDKMEAIKILKEMFMQKLPITASVYKGLEANRSDRLGNVLEQLYQALKQQPHHTNMEADLFAKLETMILRPVQNQPVMSQIWNQLEASEGIMNALKALGIMNFSESVNISEDLKQTIQQQSTAADKAQNEQLIRIIHHIVENSEQIQKAASRIQAIYHGLKGAVLTGEQTMQAQQLIEKELMPLLPKELIQSIQEQLQSISGNQAKQQALSQVLQVFSSQQMYQQLTAFMPAENSQQQQEFAALPLQQQFLTHVQHTLELIGLQDEFNLKMNVAQMEQQGIVQETSASIKSMLIQLIQEQHVLTDRMQPLLHFINGMQMQSVVDSNNLLQASFMLPGDKLLLNQDIFLQFEGKKNEEGKIDADFCRILFVLDLANLKETMIDMHVQKRIISLTIFNETDQGKQHQGLQTMLQEALGKMDYQLSSVQWKPLYEKGHPLSEHVRDNNQEMEHQGTERFDYRI